MKNFTRVHFTLVRIISLILAIIGFIGVVPFIIAGIVIMANQHFMVPLAALCMFLFPVISLVLGFILLKVSKLYKEASKMEKEFLIENKTKILGWGIAFSIIMAPTLLGLIAALICVCIANIYISDLAEGKDEDVTVGQKLKEGATKVVSGARDVWEDSKHTSETSDLDNVQAQLKKLTEMKEAGIITEEEFQAKRKKILDI